MLLRNFVEGHFSVSLASLNCKVHESVDLNFMFVQQRKRNETISPKKNKFTILLG